MLATLRKKLKGVSIRNQSLQDILSTCGEARRVISVESHPTGIHNTKLTVLLPNRQKRVQFYNRLHLKEIIDQDYIAPAYDLDAIIQDLNVRHKHDFTRDDLDIVDDYLVAKENSLGYYGESGIRVIPPFAYQYFTTSLYPFHHTESIQLSCLTLDSDLREVVFSPPAEALVPQVITLDGELKALLNDHDQPLEDYLSLGITALDSEFRQTRNTHDQPLEDVLKSKVITLDSTLVYNRITHDTQPIETLAISINALDGELK